MNPILMGCFHANSFSSGLLDAVPVILPRYRPNSLLAGDLLCVLLARKVYPWIVVERVDTLADVTLDNHIIASESLGLEVVGDAVMPYDILFMHRDALELLEKLLWRAAELEVVIEGRRGMRAYTFVSQVR